MTYIWTPAGRSHKPVISKEARALLRRCLRCKEAEPEAGLVCAFCHLDLQDVARRAAGRHWSRNGPYLNRA